MKQKTFFVRIFMSYACIICIAFVLVGAVFFSRVQRYSESEKQERMQQTMISVTEKTSIVMGSYSSELDRIYQMSLLRIARDNQANIFIADPESGMIRVWVDEDGVRTASGTFIPGEVVAQVAQTGYFSDTGGFGNLLEGKQHVLAARCIDTAGRVSALIVITEPGEAIKGIANQISQAFFIIVAIALVGTLLLAYVSSSRMTRPLKTMAGAAKQFARGEFSVRVAEDSRCAEIDELAHAFNNMARDLEHVEELTRGFIGNVSHEMKTPMTTIGGFVDGMLDGTIPEDQRDKYLKVISEEVHRLSRMVVRMLDAAKIQSGELLLAPAPFEFSEMASQIILSFEQKLNAKEINVIVDFEDDLVVMGDRDHVFRAVYNLVDNAVKFIDNGGSLRLKAAAEGKMCAFSITNTGMIPEEELSHIFDRFYKVDHSRSKDRTGAGLGLYIVKNIINLHGGDISVRSDSGEVEFSLTLPLAQEKRHENTEKLL